jgi:hypothetical protein
MREYSPFVEKAKAVLDRNWTGTYTMPSQGIYPHQWNWDSGFIAIGYSHYNTGRAVKELQGLFSAQWQNGMLPQIVFNPKRLGSYFPEPDFWQAELSPNYPRGLLTSGITMPPIHAYAALKIYERAEDKEEARGFLEWIYPRLISLHRYLYRERDPLGIGLACIRHPWESGMDNSPMWDRVFAGWDIPEDEIPTYTRKDIQSEEATAMRPDDRSYDRFVYLIEIFKRHKYDERAIQKDSPFLIYGPLFNGILSASNEALIILSEILGRDGREPAEWYEATNRAMREYLYHEEHGMFDYYDIVKRRLVDVETAAGFIPLFSGSPTEAQTKALYDYLNSHSFCALHHGSCFSIPNYDTQKHDFDRTNYWRGPIWININWLLYHGLGRYGFREKMMSVMEDILELVKLSGFHEYFDPYKGLGYGSDDFSWTAALFIDTYHDMATLYGGEG